MAANYDRIIVVNGGHYYWNQGYWYPAWGYDPGYSYVYDVPIFAYNDLPPDRVIENVQVELARLGYYEGAPDGLFGPMTRSALRGFQADSGLPITGAVDEATLYALRLA